MNTDANKLTYPTVHLNGTGKEALLAQNRAVYDALYETLVAMRGAQPHARDFYPQGPEAYKAARDEHVARLTALETVLDQYAAICENIADQG